MSMNLLGNSDVPRSVAEERVIVLSLAVGRSSCQFLMDFGLYVVPGSIMFHVRRRPADYHPRKRKKKPQQKWNKGSELMEYRYEDGYDRLPFFLELNPGALCFDAWSTFFHSRSI